MDLHSYIETVRTERRKVTDEQHAFTWFQKQIRALPAATDARRSQRTLQTVGSIVDNSAPDSGLEAVERAYEETVMSVPHYEAEYDETCLESIDAEFGAEVAAAITRSARLQPPVRQGILEAAEQARNERKQFAAVLDMEIDALEEDRTAVEEIKADLRRLNDRPLAEHSFAELSAVRDELNRLERECNELAANRQANLRRQQRSLSLSSETLDIATYLYGDHERTYPILAMIAEVGSLVHEARDSVDWALERMM